MEVSKPQKILSPNKLWSKIIVDLKKCLGPKKVWIKKIFGWILKNLRSKNSWAKNLGLKMFGTEKNVEGEKNLGPKHVLHQKNLVPKKNQG